MPLVKTDARDVRVDPLLTGISIGFRNPAYIAPDIAPVIPSQLDAGKYTVYDQPSWFRNEAAKRAASSRAKRGDAGLTFASFLCEEVAFAREVPDEVRQNAMDPIRPDQEATEHATDKILLAKEVRVATKINTTANWGGSATLAGADQWSDYSGSDPVSVIETGIDAIHGKTGFRANTMTLPWPVWKSLKHHPDIIDRIKYSQRGIATIELLQELFEIPRILLARAIYTTTNEGVAAGSETYTYVWGKHVWLGYVAPNPGLMSPTAMYQFVSAPRGIRRWREEAEHQDVVEAYEKIDEKVVSSLMGYVIRDAVA